MERPFLQQASVQDVSDFLLQHNNKLFPFVSELMDIMMTGENQSQADQPNCLAEGPSCKSCLDTDSGPLDSSLLLALQFIILYKWFLLLQSPPPLPLVFQFAAFNFASVCWSVPAPGLPAQQCGSCRSFL
eukprot:1137075-Pelagomonas_calceolata.AAC.3